MRQKRGGFQSISKRSRNSGLAADKQDQRRISGIRAGLAPDQIGLVRHCVGLALHQSGIAQRLTDDIRTKHAFVWGDLNARNQPNAFSYGET